MLKYSQINSEIKIKKTKRTKMMTIKMEKRIELNGIEWIGMVLS